MRVMGETSRPEHIFVDVNDVPLSIFIPAVPGYTQASTRFRKELRKHGAFLVQNAHEAQIIIVNTRSPTARNIIRDWQEDEGKVLLLEGWVNQSIKSLGWPDASQDWGGFLAKVSGAYEEEGQEDTGLFAGEPSSHAVQDIPPSIPNQSCVIPKNGESSAPKKAISPEPQFHTITSSGRLISRPTPGSMSRAKAQCSKTISPILDGPSTPSSSPSRHSSAIAVSKSGTSTPSSHTLHPDPQTPNKPDSIMSDSFQTIPSSFPKSLDFGSPIRLSGSSSVPSTPSSSSAAAAKFYRKKTGQAMVFYVQVNIKSRMNVVNAIKRHGGQICSDCDSADYILLDPNSKGFESSYRSINFMDRPIYQTQWVNDCDSANDLLDAERYRVEETSLKSSPNKGKKR